VNQQSEKLPVSIKLGWAVGELSVATYIGLTIAFLLFYSTQALGISPWLAGLVLLLPRLWDAFTDPLMGVISDRTRSPMGRRRPYLLVGAILLGLSFAGLFYAPVDADEMRKALHVLFFYFLASTAITIFDVPYSSMAAEMTTDYRERTSLTGYKMMAARIGILAVLFAAPVVFGSNDNLAAGFRLVGFGFGALMVIAGVAAFYLTRNAPRIEAPIQKFSARDEIDAVRKNKPFRVLWLVFLFQNLAIGASATTLLYLLTMVFKLNPEMIGPYMAIGAISATVATPFWVAASRLMTKRKGYFLALTISALVPVPFFFVEPGAFAIMFVLLIIAGAGDAANQLFPNAMVPDTVEVDELRTGERREGAIFGAWAFCRKLGMTTGAFLVSLLLSASGFIQGATADAQPESAILGIRLIYSALPVMLWLLAILVLTRYRLTEEEFNAVKAEIVGRASSKA
jgi:glycoside/pentoside/hexuronide:cation symporter, GPH family